MPRQTILLKKEENQSIKNVRNGSSASGLGNLIQNPVSSSYKTISLITFKTLQI